MRPAYALNSHWRVLPRPSDGRPAARAPAAGTKISVYNRTRIGAQESGKNRGPGPRRAGSRSCRVVVPQRTGKVEGGPSVPRSVTVTTTAAAAAVAL